MSANRTARNEAWITSLVLHVGLLAGVVAVVGRPREPVAGPVVVTTRTAGHEIGVVLLDAQPVRPVDVQPAPLPVPDTQVAPRPAPPLEAIPAPPPPAPVRTVGHQQPVANPPVANAPGSPTAVIPVARSTGPPLPPGTATAFFGVPAVGTSVVFVLDRSASMGLDGRLDRARRELADSLRRLPPATRFQVIAYNKVAEPVRVPGAFGLLSATSSNVAAVIAAVDLLPAEGGSDHRLALRQAVAMGPDVIYFLTDEDDLESRDVQDVTRLNRGRVSIHALCLVPPAGGETPMQGLARLNRGQFKVVGW